MGSPDEQLNEQARIQAVYRAWLAEERIGAYAWHLPDVLAQDAARKRIAAAMLRQAFGADLSALRVVDIGCGCGGFLRQLVEWGANPAHLAGTEYQAARLEQASQRSAPGIRWHLGDLDFAPPASFDLAVANTVFSSILDPAARARLAGAMWDSLAPGGYCMVFDFRYNNPRNVQVRRVTRAELRAWWPASGTYRSLLLAPPIARRLNGAPPLLAELLALLPPLRSHFTYLVRKG